MDVSTAIAQVEDDVRAALREQLPDGEGFAIDTDFSEWPGAPLATEDRTAMAVPWTWSGINAGLLGLDGTGAEVVVHGLTVIEEDGPSSFLCRRYVDWLPALEMAGIIIYSRPIRSIYQRYNPDDLAAIGEYQEALEEIARVREEIVD
jgi:hypothetical protein